MTNKKIMQITKGNNNANFNGRGHKIWASLGIILSLFFLNGCLYVSQQEYDTMKNSLESKNDMTIIIAVIICILMAVITLVVGNMMGSKALKDSKTHQKNKEGDNE